MTGSLAGRIRGGKVWFWGIEILGAALAPSRRIYCLRCYIIYSLTRTFHTNSYHIFTQALQSLVSFGLQPAVVGALKHICAWCADGLSF